MQFATTFGASKIDKNDPAFAEGIELGKLLVKKGYGVKCGGYGGLMEAVSIGVKEAGGVCIGITLEQFDMFRRQNPYLTKRVVAKTLFERLQLLIEGSEIFIAQKGSIGTLNEIFMTAALKYSGLMPDIEIFLLGDEYQKFNCFDANFKSVVRFVKNLEELEKII